VSDTITEEDLRKTAISFSYTIHPVKNIISDLSAMIGNFCEDTIGSFYPRVVSKKANVVLTELVNNAIENSADGRSKIGLRVDIDEQLLMIKVMNPVSREQYERVRRHVDMINSSENIRKLLRDTILLRRKDRLKGGLGLIRLVAENKFGLSVKFKEPYLIVESHFSLGGVN
jgi:hypothetical protein